MQPFKMSFLVLCVIACFVLILFGLNVFPIPGTDSIVFIPPAILFSKGSGFINPLYYVSEFTDPTHTNRFNYYVPFYPFILGLISKIRPGAKTVFLMCSLFSSAGLLLYARTALSFMPKQAGRSLRALMLLSVFYLATYMLPTVGRPENITSLLAFVLFILYSKRGSLNAFVYNSCLCILFALALASQILCFYFCFLVFLTYEVLNTTDVRKTIYANFLRVAAILLLFCVVLLLSPGGLTDTLSGITIHVSHVFTRVGSNATEFMHYWLLAPLNCGFLVVFLLCGIFYVKNIYARLKQVQIVKQVLVVVIHLAMLAGLMKFVLYAAPTVYNLTQFILPLACYLFAGILNLPDGAWKKTVTLLSAITYVAGTAIFIRWVILFAWYKSDKKDYDSAQAEIRRISPVYHNAYVTNSLWSLFDNLDSIRIFDWQNLKKDDIIIIQQVNYSFPKSFENRFTLLHDWRTNENSRFLGIQLANRPQCYGFAVYKVK